jgi:hypothetical protein
LLFRRFLVGVALCLGVPLTGTTAAFASKPPTPPPPAPPPGYWLVASDGGIFTFASPYDGSTGSLMLNKPIVGMATSPDGGGYWMVASDGGIFTFGDATYYGSTGGIRLNRPIVGMAVTPSGHGYWLVASDGGIFSFGDATYFGSTGGIRLNQAIVGMAATSTGGGYWLVASDGGIFSFGDAAYFGSMGGIRLNQPIVGMAATSTGSGYWLVAADGGIFSFGDATFYGSTGGIKLNQPIAGMAGTPSGHGYWLVASDGGIFAYGDAPYLGSMGGKVLNRPIVALGVDPIGDPYPRGTTGYDISFPQCGQTYPAPPYRVAVVGINGGRPYTPNPCLASEAAWAGPSLTVYVNVGPLNSGDPAALHGPAGSCAPPDSTCQAYNWGWNAAVYDAAAAIKAGVAASVWWLDIEFANGWKTSPQDQAENARVIQGTIDGLRAQGDLPGIYSTSYQFGLIAGSQYLPQVPLWVAGAADASQAPGFCDPSHAFGGGQIWLTQWTGQVGQSTFDQDYAC